jgi:PncC family amidohydrolase
MLADVANSLSELLAERRIRVVFAESCTAGLVAATLARVPGISKWLCGSAVTYCEATKQAWLDVPKELIEQFSAESKQVTRAMAIGVLEKTPEADLAAAVTGHLGPDAPAEADGAIFVAVARRESSRLAVTAVNRFTLTSQSRTERQGEAAALVLDQLRVAIEKHSSHHALRDEPSR